MNLADKVAQEETELKNVLDEMDKIKNEIAQLNKRGQLLTLRANEIQARIDFAKELLNDEELTDDDLEFPGLADDENG